MPGQCKSDAESEGIAMEQTPRDEGHVSEVPFLTARFAIPTRWSAHCYLVDISAYSAESSIQVRSIQ